MFNGNLSDNIEVRYVGPAVSAGSSIDNNSTRIDMSDYEGVMFVTTITDSVDTGVATLAIQQNTADSDTGMATLADTGATATSAANDDLNGKTLQTDVVRPTKRYIQAVRTSATANIAYGEVHAILYKRRKYPVPQHSTVADLKKTVSPDEA
jgi:hypothetical protein